jgi:VCBS repeat-containing protein
VAESQSVTTAENTAAGITLVATDVDGDTLTFTVVSGPGHGTLSGTAPSLTYTPAANYSGPDSFTFKANDGTLDSNVATVAITVNSVNHAPVASNDTYTTAEDTPLNVAVPGVLGNDTDVDSPTLTAILVAGPSHGTLTFNSNGSFTYAPAANYFGSDSFTYKANDGEADSNVATVSITVTPVNDAPVAANDSYSITAGSTLSVGSPGVLVNDTDIDSTTISAVQVAGPAHGTLTLNANGSFAYTPATGYSGSDSFTYKANDGQADSNIATVSITVNPASQVYLSGGDLIVNGTAGNDSIAIAASGTGVSVSINGTSYGTFYPTGKIKVFAGDGNDSVIVDSAVTRAVELHGEAGNDTLKGGAGSDSLDGGAGDDSLVAVSGNDTLNGGAGNDILQSGSGDDVLYGGDGNDTLRGTSGRDTLFGGDGNDSIIGGSGSDTLVAGAGDDTLSGGSGDDFLDGGAGNDSMDGGAGADILVGGDGADNMVGGAGNDFMIGGLGADTLLGNAADDILVGGFTDYDSNPTALQTILGVWTNGNTYDARVAALRSTSFAYYLLTDPSGQYAATVHDDGAVDYLTGSAGTDWFFANIDSTVAKDIITDLGNDEDNG